MLSFVHKKRKKNVQFRHTWEIIYTLMIDFHQSSLDKEVISCMQSHYAEDHNFGCVHTQNASA